LGDAVFSHERIEEMHHFVRVSHAEPLLPPILGLVDGRSMENLSALFMSLLLTMALEKKGQTYKIMIILEVSIPLYACSFHFSLIRPFLHILWVL